MPNLISEIFAAAENDWTEIETTIETAEKTLVSHAPNTAPAVAAVVTDIKQGASDAITAATGALAVFLGPLAKAGETALETALAAATDGISVPFNPMIENGVDQMVQTLINAATAWGLSAKAALVGNALPQPLAGA